MDLRKTALEILDNGPSRVLINSDGEAVPSKRAVEMGIEVHVVFIRSDGWSLACPMELAKTAFDMWDDDWRGVMVKPCLVEPVYPEYAKAGAVVPIDKWQEVILKMAKHYQQGVPQA